MTPLPGGGPPRRRILLKVSGEAFAGQSGRGIDVQATRFLASEIAAAAKHVSIAAVVGGGNLVRGREIAEAGINEATGHQMGMLATLINALALQDSLEAAGVSVRVMSAIPVPGTAEIFDRRRALRHLEKGRGVLFAGGTGNPYFTTDTAAVLRAAQIQADMVLKATVHVDGVYNADPRKVNAARAYRQVSYSDFVRDRLGVLDTTAITMAMERNLPVVVFRISEPGALTAAARGEPVGTLISSGPTQFRT